MTFTPQLNKKKCYTPCSQDKVKAGLCDCHNLLSTDTLTNKKNMINVDEILDNHNAYWVSKFDKRKSIDVNDAKEAIKEIITEVLKEVAESANLRYNNAFFVDKESILSTINKVKF